MNLQKNIRRIIRENRKPSNFLRRRLGMLDYEVKKNMKGPLTGSSICVFFKSNIEYFESIMENSIDFMYYNHFSHIDDNSEEWTHTYLDMVNYIRNKYQHKIMKYYDDNCGSGSIPLKESIRRILREETYSPAGDEYTPGRYVAHKSPPQSRKNIGLTGLQVSVGECYENHVMGLYGEWYTECQPAIFATDSLNEEDMFDSTYNDDTWLIDTECAGVTWYIDAHFEFNDHNHHIVTFEDISPDCLKLIHKGTGKSW